MKKLALSLMVLAALGFVSIGCQPAGDSGTNGDNGATVNGTDADGGTSMDGANGDAENGDADGAAPAAADGAGDDGSAAGS